MALSKYSKYKKIIYNFNTVSLERSGSFWSNNRLNSLNANVITFYVQNKQGRGAQNISGAIFIYLIQMALVQKNISCVL